MQNFRALGAPLPDLHASGGWGLHPQTPIDLQRQRAPPQTPQTAPLIANFWLSTCLEVRYAFFGIVRVRYVGTVRSKNWTEVRYAGTVRFKVRGT